jgi:hypothetical protein
MKKPDQKEMNKIAYNCRKATLLIEKRQLGKISLVESMELKIHLAGCSVCRVFEKQSGIIDQMVHALFHAKQDENPKLDEQFKKELQERIDRQISKR